MIEILRPRQSTLEFITRPTRPIELVGLALAQRHCAGWVKLAEDRGEKSARRHILRLMATLKTDLPGVIAWHIRPALALLIDEEIQAWQDPYDVTQFHTEDKCPIVAHENARAAAVVELYLAKFIALPQRLVAFKKRLTVYRIAQWKHDPIEWRDDLEHCQDGNDAATISRAKSTKPWATRWLPGSAAGN